MAHVGQELRLDLSGPERHVPGLPEFGGADFDGFREAPVGLAELGPEFLGAEVRGAARQDDGHQFLAAVRDERCPVRHGPEKHPDWAAPRHQGVEDGGPAEGHPGDQDRVVVLEGPGKDASGDLGLDLLGELPDPPRGLAPGEREIDTGRIEPEAGRSIERRDPEEGLAGLGK